MLYRYHIGGLDETDAGRRCSNDQSCEFSVYRIDGNTRLLPDETVLSTLATSVAGSAVHVYFQCSTIRVGGFMVTVEIRDEMKVNARNEIRCLVGLKIATSSDESYFAIAAVARGGVGVFQSSLFNYSVASLNPLSSSNATSSYARHSYDAGCLEACTR